MISRFNSSNRRFGQDHIAWSKPANVSYPLLLCSRFFLGKCTILIAMFHAYTYLEWTKFYELISACIPASTILKVSTSGLSCNGLNALINLTITRIFRLWPFHWPSVQIPALKLRILMEAAFYVSHDTLDSNFNKINGSLFVPVYNIGASSTSWKQSNISLKRLILLFESGMQ